jgi:hypothetical protein
LSEAWTKCENVRDFAYDSFENAAPCYVGREFGEGFGMPRSAYRGRGQKLTCGQLANTYQEDANALASWYSGWYNGLAHKHFADFQKGKEGEHIVIEYCKAHPDETIIHAIGLMLKDMRAEKTMMMK